jgi:hypothetical protein
MNTRCCRRHVCMSWARAASPFVWRVEMAAGRGCGRRRQCQSSPPSRAVPERGERESRWLRLRPVRRQAPARPKGQGGMDEGRQGKGGASNSFSHRRPSSLVLAQQPSRQPVRPDRPRRPSSPLDTTPPPPTRRPFQGREPFAGSPGPTFPEAARLSQAALLARPSPRLGWQRLDRQPPSQEDDPPHRPVPLRHRPRARE